MNIIISSPIIYGRKIHWVGTLAMYTTLIIPSLVKAVRYRLPARRETRSAHNGQWRTIASPHVVSRDALPSRKAKAERTRVWAGEMPSNIPGHAPRARITFCYCRRPAGIFILPQWSDRFSRTCAAFKLFAAKVSRSIEPLAERYARLHLWNCLPGCRSLGAIP